MRENEKLLLLQDYKVNKHLFDKFGIDYEELLNKPTLSTIATTGDYEDLLNKPDLPDLPTLSTVATTGSYNDLIDKPTLSIATTSTNGLMSSTDKTKLDGVKAGANKVGNSATNGNILIDNVETKVYTHPTGTNPHGTTKTDIGLSNVDNTTDLNKPISTATQTALNDKISTSQKGVANGIAQLNSNGVVPSSQLPSYVDDVLEYSSNSLFPATGESGKIYINTTTNITYRWTGSGYAEISPSIALGETSSTAYAGDKGKATTDKVNSHLADKVSHITSTERTNWNSASANKHTHTNKTVLDNTTASYTTVEQTKLSGIANNANNYTLPVASTVIGGVKSGTDITVDASGNVSVNDDSHNHIIGNVDGLQTALNGKVDDGQVLTNVPLNAKFTDTVYTHPVSHPPSIITQDANNRFVTDVEKSTWNGKATQSTIDASINALSTVAKTGKFSDLSNKPTSLSGYGITNADVAGTLGATGRTTLNGGLTVHGGTESSSTIFCANGCGIQGRKVDGTSDNLIKRNSNNTVQIGSVNHSTFIHSYSTPTVVIPSGSYKIYHEGNRPSLSDLGTTVEYSNQLSTVSTSTSVPPRTKRWTRLATLRITVQYQETNIQFNIMNNDASMDIITAIISARMKQQTAMGTNPYTGVVVNGVGFNANNFKAIMTTSTAATTLDLYVAMDEDWRTFTMSKTLGANNLSTLTPTQPFIDLPADAKFATVIFK